MKKIISFLLFFLTGISFQGFSQTTFTMSPSSGCVPLCVNFQDQSTNALSWYWDFGDASTPSTLQNPVHCYVMPGVFTVTLTETTASGTGTSTGVVTVFQNPVASFTTTPNGGNNFTFTDQSTGGAVTWFWNFGDANTSTLQNPSHTYSPNGNYQTCLMVTNTNGCFDTVCHNVAAFDAGINDPSLFSNWNIFPNPSNGNFTIQFVAPLRHAEMFRVENILGEIILQIEISNQETFDFSNHPTGIYFVRVGNSAARKLVVE